MPINPRILEFARTTREPKRPSIGRRVVGRSQIDPEILAYARQAREELQLRQQQEQQQPEDPYLLRAREELKESVLPGVKAYAIQAGAGITSLGARLLGKGEYADRMIRFSAAVEQAAREREKEGIVPAIIKRGVRGAGVSLTTMGAAGMVGGPYAAITAASAQETNSAITEGKDAGLKGHKLAGYAVGQGVWEGIPASIMQRAGLGGVESLFGKKVVSAGLIQGLKRLGILAAQEVPEEIVTELGHSVAAKISNVDPDALSAENLQQVVADTTVQTLITVAFGGAPSVARSIKAGKVEQITREAVTYVEKNKVPSRKIWRQWGLAPELGESRKQRRAFTQEIAGQLEAPVEVEPELVKQPIPQEELEAAREPVVVPEAPVVSEVPGAIMEPEAVQEGVEPPVEPEITTEAMELPEDRTIALNKATGVGIRESLDLSELGEEAVQSYETVMNDVAISKADEKAINIAQEVLASPRQINTHEHVAMVLKATKLMDNLDASRTIQSKAIETGNRAAYDQAIGQDKDIVKQLDTLTEATRNSRREIARALSIGRLRLSRENYDIVHVLQEMQIAKGSRLTNAERDLITRLTKEHAALIEEVAQLKQKDRDEIENQEKALAQKVLAIHKPRRKIGRSIREKAITEREDIKKRIRQLGLRVNDITGVPIEGTYLIGRLGITYIKEGVGTLIEVAERLRADMPDLNLSNQDVYQALISRSPREKARAKSEATKRVTRLQSLARMHVEIDNLTKGIDVARKKRAPVSEDIKILRRKLGRLRREYYKSDIDVAKLERALEKVNQLQDQLANGLISIKKEPKEIPPELVNVREQASELMKEIQVDEELSKVKKQLRTGEITVPIKKEKKSVNSRLERKRIELNQKRREIRQMIADAPPWTARRITKEVAATTIAIKATADISFTMRQNLWQVFAHPFLTSKAFIPSLNAFFSQYAADQIRSSLINSENGFLYEQSGLAILDAGSPDAQQRSEVYRRNVVERAEIFGRQNPFGAIMSASGRHAVTVGNLVRTSTFDQFMINNPNATQREMRAMADYLNASTGIGNLGKFGVIGEELQLALFSPKFAVSRIQTPWSLKKYWELPRVRKQIAQDMTKVISTGGIVLMLAYLAGADVEPLDPDDQDWGKIRIGDMRIDIWGGFQQPARVIARLATAPFRKGVDFQPLEILGRFAAFKLAPIVTVPIEFISGKTAVGEEVTKLETLGRSLVPLVLEDIAEAWEEEGAVAGISAGALAILGVGVTAYPDSETATRKKIKKLRQSGKRKEAEFLRLKWNRENPKNRIVTIK